MQILVDDQEHAFSGSAAQKIRDLAHEVCSGNGTPARQRIVIGLRCNGSDVPQCDLERVLENPISDYESLEIETAPVAAMVRGAMAHCIQVFEESQHSLQSIADLLGEGQVQSSMRQLQSFLQGWKQSQEALTLSAGALHLRLDDLRSEGSGMEELLATVRTHLGELKTAMEAGDMVLVGDILRYDLETPLSNWVSLLKEVHRLAGENA